MADKVFTPTTEMNQILRDSGSAQKEVALASKNNHYSSKSDTANFFWMGNLTIYEIANIESFINKGFKVNIWTYDINLDFKHLQSKLTIQDASIILDKNPNLNYRDRFGRTPLHHAAKSGNITAVNLII